jgi:hypothetical protein
MLERVAEDLWVESRPLRFFGVECGTKMTVARLASGGLFVHSPIALDEPTRRAVDDLGSVTAIVAPSLFHHLFVGEWARAYPNASLSCCPGLDKKRNDIAWTGILGDEPRTEWNGEIDQVFFGARTMENEVVFFHRKSKTIISCDFMFNLASHPSALTRTVAFLLGQRQPGPTFLEHLMIRKRAAARDQIDRIVAWNAERVLLAHGAAIDHDGSESIRRAYRWL